MRTVAGRVARTLGLVLEERDVREHPEWERRYLWEIPVLLWGDRELARHRTSEVELRALLALGPVEGGA
jgi:Ser/Thr protein kinase RdoA (MazF antagonist)